MCLLVFGPRIRSLTVGSGLGLGRKRRNVMRGKRGKVLLIAVLALLFALALVYQTGFAAERVVLLKVPGCV